MAIKLPYINNRQPIVMFFLKARRLFVLSFFFLLFAGAKLSAQHTAPGPYQGNAINYTRSWNVMAPGLSTTAIPSAATSAALQTTQYFDGMGRPIQSVLKQGSPLGNDMVQAHTYDNNGQETYTYLPFTSNAASGGDLTNDGTFKADAFQQQAAFYNQQFGGPAAPNLNTGDANWPYSQTDYEPSPLNRVLDIYAPGTNWVGSQSQNPGHNNNFLFVLNTPTDNVQIWNIGAAQGSIPIDGGPYAAGQLNKTITTDEQGKQTITYTNTYGQAILKKVQNTANPDLGTPSTISAHAGWLCTYYVYDDFGNLRFVIPPAVVQQIDGSWSINQTVADELCYRFEYDALNRMIIKKTPGTPTGSTGEVWMVYDTRNRLVMMQDGNMRAGLASQSGQAQWLCAIYDVLDRQVMTGTINSSSSLSAMQQQVTSQTGGNSSGTLTGAAPPSIPGNLTLSLPNESGTSQAAQSIVMNPGFSSLANGTFVAQIVPQSPTAVNNTVVVNNSPIPSGLTLTPLTATFYDNYNWLSTAGASLSALLNTANLNNGNYFPSSLLNAPGYGQTVTQSNELQGQETGSMRFALAPVSQNLWSLNIYDQKGRVIQTQSTNFASGTDMLTTQYSFIGKPLATLLSHVKGGTNPQTHLVSTLYSYDAIGRLANTTKSVTSTVGATTISTPPTTTAANTYNELGQLYQTVLGSNLETEQYAYNVRGWSLGMNRNYARSATLNGNYFGYDLGYDQPVITDVFGSGVGSYANQRYNGAIAGTVWRSKGDNQQRKYDYSYDPSSRVLAADFNQVTNGQFNKTAGIDYSVSGLSYDGNGNIGAMNQNGWIIGGSQQIDQLVYHYLNSNNSNRLQYVEDKSAYNSSTPNSPLGDFHYAGTKGTSTVDYGFSDDNGNVTSDANRGVTSIVYNYLNLPQTITFGTKGNIQFIYDAQGNKLQKVTTENNASITYNGVSYPTAITTTTKYLAGFVYQTLTYTAGGLSSLGYTDELQYLGQEQGRVRALYTNASSPTTPTGYSFDYFIHDQVNNVRMVLTDEQWVDTYPAATLETSSIANEESYYSITNDAAHVVDMSTSVGWWPDAASTNNYTNSNPPYSNPGDANAGSESVYMYKLNGATGDRFGLGITVKVMSGDQVAILGKSAWGSTSTVTNGFTVNQVVGNLLSAFAGTAPVSASHLDVTGASLSASPSVTNPLSGFLTTEQVQPSPTTEPNAAINWILFNDQFQAIAMGSSLVSTSGNAVYTHPQLNVPITANGYLYVYCSNESNIDVYFDNLQVVRTRGPLLEEKHYYPEGLLMAGISDHAWNRLINNYEYQGKELQDKEFSDGTGLAEHDFGARFYDQQLGRWHNPDPANQLSSPYAAMANNWPNGTDPDGRGTIWDDVIVMAVAFVVGTIVDYSYTHNLGQALVAGLTDAGEAELAYLGLGGGGGFGGSFMAGGNIQAAEVFSATYLTTDLLSVTGANAQLKQTAQAEHNSWRVYGLLSAYSALAAIQAGFQSNADYDEGNVHGIADRIDNAFGIDKWNVGEWGTPLNVDEFGAASPAIDNIFKGAVGYGLGGAINNAGVAALSLYNPATNTFDKSHMDLGNIGGAFASGFVANFLNQVTGNVVQNGGAALFGGGSRLSNAVGRYFGSILSWPLKEFSAQLVNQITMNIAGNKYWTTDLFASSQQWNELNSLWNDIIHGP